MERDALCDQFLNYLHFFLGAEKKEKGAWPIHIFFLQFYNNIKIHPKTRPTLVLKED